MEKNILSLFPGPMAIDRGYFDRAIIRELNSKGNIDLKISAENIFQQQQDFKNDISVESSSSVAVIPVMGIISRGEYASWFGTDIDELYLKIDSAVNDQSIKAIIIYMDSPGGDIRGVPEVAEKIYNARSIKPIVTYVSFEALSASYWLASASSEIIMQEVASAGSIGVIATFVKYNDPAITEIDVVSSVSPNKLVDPENADDLSRIQKQVDTIADIFVDNVSKYRGVSRDIILSSFGQGDVLIANDAVSIGMADAIGSFEDVFNFYASDEFVVQRMQ